MGSQDSWKGQFTKSTQCTTENSYGRHLPSKEMKNAPLRIGLDYLANNNNNNKNNKTRNAHISTLLGVQGANVT